MPATVIVLLVVLVVLGVGLVGVVIVGANVDSDEETDRDELPEPGAGGGDDASDEPELAWAYPASDVTQIASDGDRVCATSGRRLFCLDVESGDEAFAVDLPAQGSPPVIVDGMVLVELVDVPGAGSATPGAVQPVEGTRTVQAYGRDGQLRWTAAVEADTASSSSYDTVGGRVPAIAGNVLALYAQRSTGDEGYGFPAVEWVGFDAASGAERWRVPVQVGGMQVMDDADNFLASDGTTFYGVGFSATYAPVTSAELYDLDPNDPRDAAVSALLREYLIEDPFDSNEVIDAAEIDFYIDAVGLDFINSALAQQGTLAVFAVDGASGAERWRFPLDGLGELDMTAVTSAVPLPDADAVALTLDGDRRRVVVVDAASGSLRWEAPVENNDRLLDASTGNVVAHHDAVTMVVDGVNVRAYDEAGAEKWTASLEGPGVRNDVHIDLFGLTVVDGRVFVLGGGVVEIDPSNGDVEPLILGAVNDVVVVDGVAIVAGYDGVEALRLR